MNHIALNQTIFKKYAVFGEGFKGGDKKFASKTPRGYYVWINGFHKMPEISEITEHFEIGSFNYPNLMAGMGDGGGEIKYWFCLTEWEYVLLVGVKLDMNDSEDYAIDVASFVFKDRVPINKEEHQENSAKIAGELLLAHFTHFLGDDEIPEFKSFIEESDSKLLISVIDFYSQNVQQEISQTLEQKEISEEEKRISDEMDKLFGDNE